MHEDTYGKEFATRLAKLRIKCLASAQLAFLEPRNYCPKALYPSDTMKAVLCTRTSL